MSATDAVGGIKFSFFSKTSILSHFIYGLEACQDWNSAFSFFSKHFKSFF